VLISAILRSPDDALRDALRKAAAENGNAGC